MLQELDLGNQKFWFWFLLEKLAWLKRLYLAFDFCVFGKKRVV